MRFLRLQRPDPTRLIEEKIQIAQELFDLWGEALKQDDEIAPLLDQYREAVNASNQIMSQAGTFQECYICSVEEKKGCCKIGLENECTILILILNLLLGVKFPKEREIPGGCFFVGPRGCKIFARPMLCRDYFCIRHYEKIPEEVMAKITQVLQDELMLLHKITRLIKYRLECWTGDFLLELDLTGYV